MEQAEKREYLIKTLLAEQPKYRDVEIPEEAGKQKRLLRSLFNVRMPGKISEDFLKVQDEYLQEEAKENGITDLKDLQPIKEGIYVRRSPRALVFPVNMCYIQLDLSWPDL